MKTVSNCLVLLYGLLISQQGYAQWTTSGSTIYNTNTGNVGIGITIPVTKFHVGTGGVTIGNNIFTSNANGHLSIGDITTSDMPTPSNWTDKTTLIITAQNYSTIGFADAGNYRVDYIRAGNGTIQLGYDAGWGRANIGLPNGIWNSSGNVGIGTIAPETTFQTYGSEILSTGPVAGIRFRDRVAGPRSPSETYLDDWVWYAAGNIARFHRGGVGDLMAVTSTGNLGIGTGAPVSKLHIVGGGLTLGTNVFGAISDGHLSLGDVTTTSTPTLSNAADQATMILNAKDYSTIGFHHVNNRMDFIRVGNGKIDLGYDGGWGRAHVGFADGIWGGNGNVGLGTTNPVTKLHVSTGGVTIGNNIATTNANGHLSIGDLTTSDFPTPTTWTDKTTLILNAQKYSAIGFYDNDNGNSTGHARVDFIRSGNGTIQLGYDAGWGPANIGFTNGIWRSDGNVGIGTTNPGAYKLAVEGKIGAREVEVKTGSWADFVFAKDYILPSLDEVESHIKANQHLPGIPSEAEVKEKGYALGEMDAKLLQKIEELTLYIIDLKKQVDDLKRQNNNPKRLNK